MRLERMLGHLTTLTSNKPTKVLVIGCGAGVTAGAVSIDPRVEHVVIVEIEPLVPHVVSGYFGEYNSNVLKNPKTEVIIDVPPLFVDDARKVRRNYVRSA